MFVYASFHDVVIAAAVLVVAVAGVFVGFLACVFVCSLCPMCLFVLLIVVCPASAVFVFDL